MLLYHGSTKIITTPLLVHSKRPLDFGPGFYTTTNFGQAEKWALIKKRRLNAAQGVVNCYEFSDQLTSSSSTIKVFESPNEEWLDFITANRMGTGTHNYDIIKGPVADDTVFETILLYESGTLSKEETIARLKVHHLYDQISFHTDKVLRQLKFLKHKNILSL
ncbi:DUF3990 domain-containing protein [Hoylesella enoeca]|uniref:DUF3990 domain-containing protein n=1 Tax=Hoylesella enoeca TaxID=76123 RepID=UPI00288B26B8|nr:DUF3990 domain-containing protein [Hoylesella enoeca]